MSGPTDDIEAIQNHFLRFFAFKCGVHRKRHTYYLPLLKLTNLETLQIRRIRLDLCFAFKLLNGIINCSELLVKFNFLVPNPCTRNYAKNSPISRIMSLVNKHNVDLFSCSFVIILSLLMYILKII